ncbi:MAG: hypothetical protein L0K86_29820, partial [Actinomycetia bacterium]|nr:hypothetical protein [Actinomycetes bacterium]
MGERSIAPMGHVRMMAAVQPFLSGAISKCVVGSTLLTSENGLIRIGSLYGGEQPDTFRDEVLGVASRGGPQKSGAYYYGGERPVREIELRSGHRVTGTPNHRVLVAVPGGPQWRRLDQVREGDHIAVQYGADMWSMLPASFGDFHPCPPYGSQKSVQIPGEMTEELAFLLGAYAAEGCVSASNWTIRIANSVDAVLERVAAAWRTLFGVEAVIDRPRGKCPQVVVASKTIVEFLRYLEVGSRAAEKRVPDAVLRSPRPMVLAFLQGLALDAYVRVPTDGQVKWAICLDSSALLDDLQAILTNLGVVHGRVSKFNKVYSKAYDEVYASGEEAQRMAKLVPFLEPDKAQRAARLIARPPFRTNPWDVVPGITGRQLYAALPPGDGRHEFRHLLDDRTTNPSRATVERVVAVAGSSAPAWLREVLRDGLHFSPILRVRDAGQQVVHDVSVPATRAFVGNGVVNHNTVNMPEAATVTDVEKTYLEGWKLGLKALAIYRDN